MLHFVLFFLYASSTNMSRAFNERQWPLTNSSFSFSSLFPNVNSIFSVEMRWDNQSNPPGGPYNFVIEEGGESNLRLHSNHKIFTLVSLFFISNHFLVTIASLREDSLSFDKAFLIFMFQRPKYFSFSCLSFIHLKNHLFKQPFNQFRL